jgi:hypothetical protein
MITQDSVLVQLIRLVDHIPSPPPPPRRPPGRPIVYSERLFLKALLIMIIRRLHKVGELLAVLEENTSEMRSIRALLSEGGRFPSKRTFQRRLKALPEKLPEQIGSLGRHLVEVLKSPGRVGEERWLSTVPLCRQKVECGTRKTRGSRRCPPHIHRHRGWLDQERLARVGVWMEALDLAITVAGIWIPLSARLTPADVADNQR